MGSWFALESDHRVVNAPRERESSSFAAPGTSLTDGRATLGVQMKLDGAREDRFDTASAPAAAVQRKCDGCAKEDEKLQRKSSGSARAGNEPPAADVHRAASRGLASASGSLPYLNRIQRSFGDAHDLSRVKTRIGGAAARASASLGAVAYAMGDRIAFREPPSLKTAAHEAAHVVQQRGGVKLPNGVGQAGDSHERHADAVADAVAQGRSAAPLLDRYARRASSPAQPGIQRNLDLKESLPQMGRFALTGRPIGSGLGAHEDVKLEFDPDAQSPTADPIEWVQIAKPPGPAWGVSHPEEALKGETATKAGAAVHQTKAGDTLTTVSQQHFGTPNKASQILDANMGKLVWWSAQSGAADDRLTRALPVGTLLQIPDAVQGGFMVDVHPSTLKPRTDRAEANVSPNYPEQGTRKLMPGGYIGREPGYKKADGSKQEAVMTDLPGGGPYSGKFEFESAAVGSKIGVTYGVVRWGFTYDGSGVSNEHANLVPGVSDTFKAATASFNRVARNKHVVQQGETLDSISIQYYGDATHAHAIYLLNRTVAGVRDDGKALIPGGTQLEVGVGPTIWDQAKADAAKK